MDTHTLELLEFDKVRALVAKRAACSLGKERAWRMEPSRDPGEIRNRQALTTEMLEALSSGLTPPFGGLHDIRPQVRRAQIGAMLDAEELAQAVETLRAIGHLNQWLSRIGEEFPRLGGLKQEVGEFSGVVNAIEGCLDSRGNVLDTASRKLSALRREIGQVEEKIQETLRRMLRSNEIKRILRFPNFTMVGHHYVLPIAKEHRGEIQGSVHRTSASNETVYIEPQAIAEHSAQLSFIRAREAKEIRRILRWLSAQLGQVAESALGSLETLGELDLIHARGRYSLDGRMTPPDFNEEGKLALRGARHPLLEAFFRGDTAPPRVPEPPREAPTEADESPPAIVGSQEPRTVVPIDVHLGLQFQTLVVTGPNTGGKTVAIKTVGLLAIMAQAGLHIPAHQGSQLPVFDEVLADIGDEQSLEQSLSTFSSHVRRVTEILARASSKSLVLLDEMGAGTDPAEGAALGRAILDEIDSIGARAIVTTHLGDLKTYAFSNPRVENAAVEFDLETLRPRYRLHIGDIGQSNALQIARRLSLPEHIVARAAKYLAQGRGQDLPELEILQKLRKDAEEARQAALTAQSEAERTREALNQRLTDLQRQAENDERLADARARLQPGDRVVVPKFGYDRPGRVVKLDARKKTAVVAIGQMQWDVAISDLIPQTMRTPEVAAPANKPKAGANKNAPRLEDFADESSSR
ncbi:endonuclease MutS2 [Singulisphaera acidiphila]|uniref:Mismatch repair ATPase (MutS family) n=1 Tax=Singulisphaera acidiphila (strain ATCC BAA-1392 / DSM 18658 / VKM B-2454 / MOB10) TaxID=886293 RepID=L0DCR1_SINAD|nr:DNA strand exchange inhibitor protein [Singulisphaera acidiphila]AGA27164.1 mismatch repair ATPase (MutS family) [Singulisphaera acidiphila DSM 18658]